jgi:RNA 2',3'-cyclic 3'-phosphodiesterase
VGGYDQIWRDFVEGRRLEYGGHTDPSWREGHTISTSLMVRVDASSIRDRLLPIRDALRPFPFVSLHPDYFLHVTLYLLGFLSDDPDEEDEVAYRRLEEIEASARRALSDFPAFTVSLANLNAFPGAAFVEVYDGGMLEELRGTLSASCGLKRPPGPTHMTLAYFQAQDGFPAPESLVSTIARFRNWPVGEVPIANVEMTLLDLRSKYPKPETFAEMPLKKLVS